MLKYLIDTQEIVYWMSVWQLDKEIKLLLKLLQITAFSKVMHKVLAFKYKSVIIIQIMVNRIDINLRWILLMQWRTYFHHIYVYIYVYNISGWYWKEGKRSELYLMKKWLCTGTKWYSRLKVKGSSFSSAILVTCSFKLS